MFKFVVLSCLVSVALAGHIAHPVQYTQVKHIVEPQISVVETPTINHVGSVVKNIPTGVSHHSNSVVHSAANIVEPIYAHGVEKSVVSTPIVKNVVEHVQAVQYSAPAVHYAAPAVQYAAAPAVHYAEPIIAKSAYVQAPVYAKAAYVQQPIAYAAYAPKALSYSSVHQPAHYAQAYAPAAYSSYSALPYAQYAHHY